MAGALTVTVCANLKQCLTILFGIAMFNVKVNLLNGFGMLLAILGAAWYSNVELKRKTRVHTTTLMQEQGNTAWLSVVKRPNR